MPDDFANPCSVGGCEDLAVMGFTFDNPRFNDDIDMTWRCFDHAPEVK